MTSMQLSAASRLHSDNIYIKKKISSQSAFTHVCGRIIQTESISVKKADRSRASCSVIFCVRPLGGAVTQKVSVAAQHMGLSPNWRNPSNCLTWFPLIWSQPQNSKHLIVRHFLSEILHSFYRLWGKKRGECFTVKLIIIDCVDVKSRGMLARLCLRPTDATCEWCRMIRILAC